MRLEVDKVHFVLGPSTESRPPNYWKKMFKMRPLKYYPEDQISLWKIDINNNFISFFFSIRPPPGLLRVRTAGTVQTPTLDTALLNSSRAGADLGCTSDAEYDASPGWEEEVWCWWDCFSDVSLMQMFFIQIPTVLCGRPWRCIFKQNFNRRTYSQIYFETVWKVIDTVKIFEKLNFSFEPMPRTVLRD